MRVAKRTTAATVEVKRDITITTITMETEAVEMGMETEDVREDGRGSNGQMADGV